MLSFLSVAWITNSMADFLARTVQLWRPAILAHPPQCFDPGRWSGPAFVESWRHSIPGPMKQEGANEAA
jgi:hypothetical protein